MKPERQWLQIYRLDEPHDIAKEFEVTGKSERQIEKVIAGALRNMHPDYDIRQIGERLRAKGRKP